MIIADLRRRIPGTFAGAAVAAGLLMATSVGPSFQVAGSHAEDEGDDPGGTEDFEAEEIVDLDDEDWEDLTEGETEAEEETEDPETPADEESSASIAELEESEEENDRSETATRVHAALSGDPDIGPGHEEFGQRVSERARTMHLGSIVSRAARGIDDELELSESSEGSSHPGNNGRGNGRGRR